MSLDSIENIDKSRMYETYERWPVIAKDSWEENIDEIDVANIDHIVFTGMGGSGTISDVMKGIFSKENIHVNITKGYVLPKTVDADTLIVATSVSGNTDETLSILKQANESDAKIAAFSAGGKIEEFCKNNDIFFKKIPIEHSPRASFTKFLFIILNVLKKLTPISDEDVAEAITSLEETQKKINTSNTGTDNISLKIAKWIKHTPVIYYPNGLNAVATRFKNSLQENSKIHVVAEEVLEVCHNGIVVWDKESNFQPILVRGEDDHKKTKERWDIIKEFFKSHNIEFLEINSVKGSILTKIINLIYVADFATIYHAVLNGVDPSPVLAIDYIKKRL